MKKWVYPHCKLCIIENIDSIRVEDLKIYEPVYKCFREKGHYHICNISSNIICKNYNENIWICVDHWQQHLREVMTFKLSPFIIYYI